MLAFIILSEFSSVQQVLAHLQDIATEVKSPWQAAGSRLVRTDLLQKCLVLK